MSIKIISPYWKANNFKIYHFILNISIIKQSFDDTFEEEKSNEIQPSGNADVDEIMSNKQELVEIFSDFDE